MVDYSHLSAGNSSASSSRDLVAEYGLFNPITPLEDMAESDLIPSNPLVSNPSPGSGEEIAPLDMMISSEESYDAGVAQSDLGLANAEATQEILKAAQYFSHKDRLEASEERRKNSDLMRFLSEHGFSCQQVNDFIQKGKKAMKAIAVEVLDDKPTQEPVSNSLKLVDLCPPSGSDLPPTRVDLGGTISEGYVPSTEKKTWSSIVSQETSRTKVCLEYFPPDPSLSESGSFLVRPPRDILIEGNKRWQSCLVGGFLNSRLPFKLVEENAHRLWGKLGLKKVFLQEKGYFVFQFSTQEERENVLALGPWYFLNKLIILKQWKEGIDFRSDATSTIPIWVKFHKVPMSYWSPKGLSFLASTIGKPILLDKSTDAMIPMSFARLCIEVTTASSFPEKLDLVVFDEKTDKEFIAEVKVEYQNRPQICQHCNSFGHSMIKCYNANYKWLPKAANQNFEHLNKSSSSSMAARVAEPDNFSVNPGDGKSPSMVDQPGQETSDSWTLVSKGIKINTPPALISDNLTCNQFSYLEGGVSKAKDNSSEAEPSPSPSPNPLRDKLKMIDEKEHREMKNKNKSRVDHCLKPKKKSKGGGGTPPT